MDKFYFLNKTIEILTQRIDFITSLINTSHAWAVASAGMAGVCMSIVVSFVIGYLVVRRVDKESLDKLKNDMNNVKNDTDQIKDDFEKKYDVLLRETESSRQYFSKLFEHFYENKIQDAFSQKNGMYFVLSLASYLIGELLSKAIKDYNWSEFFVGQICLKILQLFNELNITNKNNLDLWWEKNKNEVSETIGKNTRLGRIVEFKDIYGILKGILEKLLTVDTTPIDYHFILPNGERLEPVQPDDKKSVDACRNKLKEILT